MQMSLKFKLNSLAIVNTLVITGIILMVIALHYEINNSYAQREFMINFDKTLQSIRVLEKTYLQLYDESNVNMLFAQLDGLKQNLNDAVISSDYKMALGQKIEQYGAIFNKVIDLHKNDLTLIEKMQNDVAAIDK